MSNSSKVVWSEGIFITPQHFQQQERYIEDQIDNHLKIRSNFFYGVNKLTIDESSFSEGVFRVSNVHAILNDGTLVNCINSNLELRVQANNSTSHIIYLVLQGKNSNNNQICFNAFDCNSRYFGYDKKILDITDVSQDARDITVARLNIHLKLEKDLTDNLVRLPIAKIIIDLDGSIKIDNTYIPPTINSQENILLKSYISELYALLLQKCKSLSEGMSDPNRAGSVEIVDFLMLQTVNRYFAYLQHQNNKVQTHPEHLFVELSKLCADLMTFSKNRRVDNLPNYEHNNPSICFKQLMDKLRQSLSIVLEQRIIRINLERRDEATYVAQTPEHYLLDTANFVLAVKADLSDDELRQKVPSTMKISTVEKIKDLISFHLPGIKLNALAIVPRELPYHNGYVYFELDKKSELWASFNDTSGMAFHLAGEFPNVDLEFWAIKASN